MSELERFDKWLSFEGPSALVIREWLMPVEGVDGVVFPPTFAAAEDKKVCAGGYNIDSFANDQNIALIDSVGAQANRIEPIFMEERYRDLVPQIVIEAGEKKVNLLLAGHRAGDAVVRCSSLRDELRLAFQEVLKGNAGPLARIAPTSLVFGVWDSRDTQAKLPRLVCSAIRAFDVRSLHRSAQYNPAAEYVKEQLLDEPDDKEAKKYAERGFIHVPATWNPGGVIAEGGIRRDATLALAALRLIREGNDEEKTRALQRYVLGLALVALTANPGGYLRQGCLLVLNPDRPREYVEVDSNGVRRQCQVTHQMALSFAKEAAQAFGKGKDRTVPFDRESAKAEISGTEGGKKAKKSSRGKAEEGDGQ